MRQWEEENAVLYLVEVPHLAYTATTADAAMPRISRRSIMHSHLSPLAAKLQVGIIGPCVQKSVRVINAEVNSKGTWRNMMFTSILLISSAAEMNQKHEWVMKYLGSIRNSLQTKLLKSILAVISPTAYRIY
jgi:hypothetical protein